NRRPVVYAAQSPAFGQSHTAILHALDLVEASPDSRSRASNSNCFGCPSLNPFFAMNNKTAISPRNGAASDPVQVVEVDARGLEPPQPLVKILEALAALPAGAELRAFTDRRPMHLYAQLEERGFAAVTEEQPDGTFLTHIRRR